MLRYSHLSKMTNFPKLLPLSPIQPPEPLITPSAPTVSNPEPISSLPPVPARLRDCIIAGAAY